MKVAKQKKLLLWAGIFVIMLVLAAAVFRYLQKRPTLIDLQKEMLTAETEEEKQEILEKLDRYYLTMPIPEAIRQEVEDSVDALIQRFDPAQFTPEELERRWANLDSNIYLVENQLSDLLREAMIARKLEDMNTLRAIMSHAERLAGNVDSGTDNNYWRPWIAKVKNFNVNMARYWLLADQAQKLCYKHHLGDFERAEEFGRMAMQLLQRVEDERLRLDVTQRLLVILFQYRGLFDLSFAFADRGIQSANEIKYFMRATGLTYNYAEALYRAGENHKALEGYLKTLERVKVIDELPGINWYEINARLGMADINLRLGYYKKSLSICDEIDKLHLNNFHKHVLYNTRGVAYTYLGKYDLAKAAYRSALSFAMADNDTINQINVLSNLGKLHFRLTEYDKANMFYQDEMELLLEYSPENLDFRIRILIRFAELAAAQNREKRVNDIIKQSGEYVELINNPTVKGRYLVTLGQLNIQVQNYRKAYENFLQATKHYETFGMIRDGLETKTKLINTLIELKDYQEAKRYLKNQFELATEINDLPTQVEAIGLSSHIAYKQGNIEQAVQKSNRLINIVEELSSQISDLDILTTFRQKVNPFLKNAVLYELRRERIDSAFIKLDYLKAREAKHRFASNKPKSDFHSPILLDIDSLKIQLTEDQTIVNYLATEDTLFAFLLHQSRLDLFKWAIHIDELRRLGNDYINIIKNSRKNLDPYQPSSFKSNYDSVMSMGRELYGILLGWPELNNIIQQSSITYIIPDDILYGLPFSCLNRFGDPKPEFLVQKTGIVYLPSATFWQSFQSETLAKSLPNKRILVCADRDQFPKVEQLLKYIRNKFPKAEELIIDKSNIEKEDVLAKLDLGYDIYFLIGHSMPNLKFPDLTNIHLTPLRKHDKMPFRVDVSLSDLKQIDWSHSEMVFLIGCETSIGKLYEGSGFAGFQQIILTRGAEGVMASYWEIDNAIAFQQIEDFLDFWVKTGNPALALQTVEIESIKRLQEDVFYEAPHPYLWKILNLSQTIKYYKGG